MKSTPNFFPCQCHIIPDVVFKELKKKGTDVESGSSERIDQDFREKRAEFTMVAQLLPTLRELPGNADRYVYNSQNTGKQKLKLARKVSLARVIIVLTMALRSSPSAWSSPGRRPIWGASCSAESSRVPGSVASPHWRTSQ